MRKKIILNEWHLFNLQAKTMRMFIWKLSHIDFRFTPGSYWLFPMFRCRSDETPPQFCVWKDFEGHFLKCCTLAFSQIWLFSPPRTSPPAAKTCQAGASQSKGVRGHQLESHPRPREPAAQLATGSGMSDFLHGVTAVCVEVSASSQCAVPFSVWRGRSHLNSKEPSQCHQ